MRSTFQIAKIIDKNTLNILKINKKYFYNNPSLYRYAYK